MQNEPPSLTDKEDQLLQHIADVVKVLKLHSNSSESENDSKPAWLKFLESTGGVALITVVLGGMLGQCVTSNINAGLKEREAQQAENKGYNERTINAAKSYLEQEQEIVKRAYELVGKCVSDSDDIVDITGEEFNPQLYQRQARKDMQKLRNDIREEYNSSDKQWRSDGVSLGLLMSYYHNGNKEVLDSWRNIQDSLNDYKACAEDRLRRHGHEQVYFKTEDVENACSKEKQKVRDALDSLTGKLENSRLDALKKWETPPPPQP